MSLWGGCDSISPGWLYCVSVYLEWLCVCSYGGGCMSAQGGCAGDCACGPGDRTCLCVCLCPRVSVCGGCACVCVYVCLLVVADCRLSVCNATCVCPGGMCACIACGPGLAVCVNLSEAVYPLVVVASVWLVLVVCLGWLCVILWVCHFSCVSSWHPASLCPAPPEGYVYVPVHPRRWNNAPSASPRRGRVCVSCP